MKSSPQNSESIGHSSWQFSHEELSQISEDIRQRRRAHVMLILIDSQKVGK